jgi:drug/metabolite transporter (DMT)-like permease
VLLGAWDLQFRTEYFLGDVICFGSMVLFASYLVLGRVNRDFPSLWLYMAPLYFFAGLTCAAVALLTTDFHSQPYDVEQLALLVGLGVIPTVVGHGCLNHALKYTRGQVVGVANLGQVVSAGILAFLILGEVPEASFYPASALIGVGIAWALLVSGKARDDAKQLPPTTSQERSRPRPTTR